MESEQSPWLCGKCGYSLHGLGDQTACPECGSSERKLDLNQFFRRSNIRYTCAFTIASCSVFAATLILSLFEQGPSFYGLSAWWLLLGWLAGAIIGVVGISTLSKAQYRDFATLKLPIRSSYVTFSLGVASAMLLFKAINYKGWYGIDPVSLKYGIYISPAIALTTALLPTILALHFKKASRNAVSKRLFLTAALLTSSAAGITGMYFLVWLDWTVGIDLYLSQSHGYQDYVTVIQKLIALLGAGTSIYGIYAGAYAYRAT